MKCASSRTSSEFTKSEYGLSDILSVHYSESCITHIMI